MARVEIVESLYVEIEKKFKQEGHKVLNLIESLEDNPKKGKAIGIVGGLVIKEIKYKSFRFYFIVDGYKLKCYDENELIDILLRFVRMSDKKHQQRIINEIKDILIKIGPEGLK
ncbi:MAG: hypothetical protein ACLFN8_04020 [Candidatus Woesearchaeota archaeon]